MPFSAPLANFRVKSDPTGNGSVIVDGFNTGDFLTVERYIPAYTGPNDGWHQIATPVDFMPVAGSDFDPGPNDDLYQWDEVNYIWENYKAGWDVSDLYSSQGYLVAFETAATRDFYGLMTNWDSPFSNLSVTTGKGEGWHFMGNPYPSAIEWGTTDWALTNIGGIAQIWNDATGNYALINPSVDINC